MSARLLTSTRATVGKSPSIICEEMNGHCCTVAHIALDSQKKLSVQNADDTL